MQRELDGRDLTEADIRVTPVRKVEPDVDVTRTSTRVVMPRDSVRWGPVWAGLITALTTFVLLELLMYSLGLLTLDLNPADGGTSGPWTTAVVGLIAFFIGGWVAGATSAIRGATAGLLNGFLVWGLGTVLILALSSFGLGSLFGAFGNAISSFLFASRPNQDLINVDPAQIANVVRNASWWAFVSLAVSALACTLGGWAGAKSGRIGRAPTVEETR